jgi:hypothetical protein
MRIGRRKWENPRLYETRKQETERRLYAVEENVKDMRQTMNAMQGYIATLMGVENPPEPEEG